MNQPVVGNAASSTRSALARTADGFSQALPSLREHDPAITSLVVMSCLVFHALTLLILN